MTEKVKPQDKPHYVNNKEFSLAVVDYCNRLQKAQKQKSKKSSRLYSTMFFKNSRRFIT